MMLKRIIAVALILACANVFAKTEVTHFPEIGLEENALDVLNASSSCFLRFSRDRTQSYSIELECDQGYIVISKVQGKSIKGKNPRLNEINLAQYTHMLEKSFGYKMKLATDGGLYFTRY